MCGGQVQRSRLWVRVAEYCNEQPVVLFSYFPPSLQSDGDTHYRQAVTANGDVLVLLFHQQAVRVRGQWEFHLKRMSFEDVLEKDGVMWQVVAVAEFRMSHWVAHVTSGCLVKKVSHSGFAAVTAALYRRCVCRWVLIRG